MADNWLWMSAGDLGRGIGAGTIDPVDLTEAYLDAAETHPESARIYARITRPRALAEAKAAAGRAKAGLRVGPLDGVPISWKDLFDTAGIETEAGSALLKDRRPKSDAEVLVSATFQGLVCLGKTHMSELAFSGLGLNPVTATPPGRTVAVGAVPEGIVADGPTRRVAVGVRQPDRLVLLDAERHLDVPLYWQHWKLRTTVLDALTESVCAAAATILVPPAQSGTCLGSVGTTSSTPRLASRRVTRVSVVENRNVSTRSNLPASVWTKCSSIRL